MNLTKKQIKPIIIEDFEEVYKDLLSVEDLQWYKELIVTKIGKIMEKR